MIEFITDYTQRYRKVAGITLLGLLVGVFFIIKPTFCILLMALVVGIVIVIYIFFNKHGILSLKQVVIPLLMASILFPPIRLPAGIPAVRFDLILILVTLVLLLLGALLTGKWKIPLRRNSAYKWFFLFGVAIFISIAYAAFINGCYPIGRDLFELVKLLKYFLIFTLVANLDISVTDLKHYYVISLIIFLFSAFVGFAQFFNLWNINDVISPYYAPTQMRGLLVHGRITGTTGNPNVFGMLMTLASSLALSGVLFFCQRRLRLFSLICLAVFVLAIVFTLSRTSLVSLTVAGGFIFFFKYPLSVGVKRYALRLLTIIPLLIVIYLAIVQIAPDKFFVRVEGLKNIQDTTSWQGRVNKWQHHVELFKQSPVFGWGPGKDTMETVTDNEWLLLLRRYGIVGTLIFISWVANLYFGLSKIRRNILTAEGTSLTIALQGFLVACAVYMIPAAIYHSLQLMPILFLFLGLGYSQSRAKSHYPLNVKRVKQIKGRI